MVKLGSKTIRELNKKDLRDKLEEMRSELSKLRVESSKGTLRKESGKLKPVRKNKKFQRNIRRRGGGI